MPLSPAAPQRRRIRLPVFTLLSVAMLVLAGPALQQAAAQAPTDVRIVDKDVYERAFASIARGRLGEARRIGRAGNDPVLTKVLDWYYFQELNSGATFKEIAAFIGANPGWPHMSRLLLHAEREMPKSTPDAEVVAWFEKHRPKTMLSDERYARALLRLADKQGATAGAKKRLKAQRRLRLTWVQEPFRGRSGQGDAMSFLARNKEHLRETDHFLRAERLLWKKRVSAAKQLLPYLSDDHKKIVKAWAALSRDKMSRKDVDAAFAMVGSEARLHPGIQYAYMQWLVKKGDKGAAEKVMLDASRRGPLGNAKKWWLARDETVRDLLARKEYNKAYTLAAHHGLKEGKHFAEAEFLLGWIALRFLNQPRQAQKHFLRLHAGVQYPLSQSRAGYWTARANAALGDTKAATKWYRIAANYPGTFYGQLAAIKLGEGFNPRLSAYVSAKDREDFEKSDLVQAVRKLGKLGAGRTRSIFLRQIFRSGTTPAMRVLAIRSTLESGDRKLAVATSKLAHRKGDPLVPEGYPIQPMKPFGDGAGPEEALVLGLIRQESMFDVDAMSWVGARGLMQLMPRTAREVARNLKVRYNVRALTRDPDYNLKLGRAYLQGRVREFNGYYPMAAAAYNAGPGRVRQWMAKYGDPRRLGAQPEDMVDWIEHIPFDETRAYVMRVLENLMVYRWKLGEAPLVPESPDHMFKALPNRGVGTMIARVPGLPGGSTAAGGGKITSKISGEIKPNSPQAAQRRRQVAAIAAAPPLPPQQSPILLEPAQRIPVRAGSRKARAVANVRVTGRPEPNPLRGKRAWPSPPTGKKPVTVAAAGAAIPPVAPQPEPGSAKPAEKKAGAELAGRSPTAPPPAGAEKAPEAKAAPESKTPAGFPKGPPEVKIAKRAQEAGQTPKIKALPKPKPADAGSKAGGKIPPKPKITGLPRPHPNRKARHNPKVSAIRAGDRTWPSQVAGN